METHSFSLHFEKLNSLCRICAERVHRKVKDKNAKAKLCMDYSTELLFYHDLDVKEDSERQHSKNMCQKCYFRLMKMKKSSTDTPVNRAKNDIEKSKNLWCRYDEQLSVNQCVSCNHFDFQTMGGRPKKSNVGAPKRKLDNSTETLMTETDSDCYDTTGPSTSTPLKQIKTTHTQTSPQTIHVHEASLSLGLHNTPLSATADLSQTSVPSELTPRKKLRKFEDIKAPLSQTEEAFLTKLAKAKARTSTDKKTLLCKTGGPSVVFKHIPQPRKTSSLANSPLRKKRSKVLDKLRTDISGSSLDDSIMQQSSEIKTKSKQAQQKILESAGCKKATLTSKQGSAMRTQLGMTWSQYRSQKKFLKSVGVEFSSERKERQEQKQAMFGEVHVENTKLFVTEDDNRTQEKNIPVGTVRDIPQLVGNLLDQYEREGKLTWHENTIPNDEIWVKMGGDHGGGSFKQTLQIANLNNPNSKHNTCLVLICACKDSPSNLRRLLHSYKEQLERLKTMTWKGKKIIVFLYGDYDFLCKLYGISGAQGAHPCIFCTASKSQTQNPPELNEGNVTQRSLEQIKKDNRKFRQAKKKVAKHHNNAIRRPILDIELDHVAPPYLHILLGITKKHDVLLEKECHELDTQIAESIAKAGNTTDTTLHTYVEQVREIDREEENMQLLAGHYVFNEPDDESTLADFQTAQEHLQDQIHAKEDEIERLKSHLQLSYRSGPVTKQLDTVLRAHKICKQQYHGRSYIGNHCNKYFQTETIDSLCNSILTKTTELTADEQTRAKAQSISNKFKTLNSLYSQVHKAISHSRPMTEEDIDKADENIKQYMSFFRNSFPTTKIIPKQHLLEVHCVTFMRQYKFGLGLHGEQGGEEIHAVINRLMRRAWGMRCEEDKLTVILNEQMALVSPVLQSQLASKSQSL